MGFFILDATARSSWAAATNKTAQLEGLRDVWSGQAHLKHYSSGGTLLATVVHATPVVDTNNWELVPGAYVSQTVWASGVATYCVWAVPGGADILRADSVWDAADPTISDPGGRVRVDIGSQMGLQATASLPDGIPAWVPSAAWEWTSITGTVWTDYMTADGTGIAPDIRSSAGDPGPTYNYGGQWTFSAPTYSRAHHEMYMFGGGHAETTVNCVTRWNLSLDSPTVTIVSAATSIANRNSWLNGGAVSQGYELDGKPRSPHSYWNNQFSDSTNEFISFGISTTATGYPTASGSAAGSTDIAACSRTGTWRAEDYYYDVQQTLSTAVRGPRAMSYDGTAIYYWDGNDASDTATLKKWTIGTGAGAHTSVGNSVIPFYSRQAANSSGTALVLGGADSSAGWQAKFVNLSTGAVTAVTVTGSIASGLGIWDVTWCEDRGYWLCMWVNTTAANVSSGAGVAITDVLIATIEATGASTATATTRTMTGTAPSQMYPLRGAFYDPTYGCVLVATDHSAALKAIKVSA